MHRSNRIVDRPEPGLVAARREQQPRRLQHDGDDRVEDGNRDRQADQHGERMTTARLEEIFDLLRRGQEADQVRRTEQDGGQRDQFRRHGDEQRPHHHLADAALGVLRLLAEIGGGAIAVIGEDGDGGGRHDEARRGRHQRIGGVEDLRRREQAGKRPLDMDEAQHRQDDQRQHLDAEENAGDEGVELDAQRRHHAGQDDGGHADPLRVEVGHEHAEIGADAERHHGDDQHDGDEDEDECDKAPEAAERAADHGVFAAGRRIG